jgi:hypothetical protein
LFGDVRQNQQKHVDVMFIPQGRHRHVHPHRLVVAAADSLLHAMAKQMIVQKPFSNFLSGPQLDRKFEFTTTEFRNRAAQDFRRAGIGLQAATIDIRDQKADQLVVENGLKPRPTRCEFLHRVPKRHVGTLELFAVVFDFENRLCEKLRLDMCKVALTPHVQRFFDEHSAVGRDVFNVSAAGISDLLTHRDASLPGDPRRKEGFQGAKTPPSHDAPR